MTNKNPNDPNNLPKEAADRLGRGEKITDNVDETRVHDRIDQTRAGDNLNETRVNEERIKPSETTANREVRTDSRPATTTGGSTAVEESEGCLLYTSPSPRDGLLSRMPSSA